jgi:D-alanyl-D-alanine carboxypeptidase/D-alanyl-D-alanine-endopeptidase (penicillin-binding protein 4)
MSVQRTNEGGLIKGVVMGVGVGTVLFAIAWLLIGTADIGRAWLSDEPARGVRASAVQPAPAPGPLDGVLASHLAALHDRSLLTSEQGVLVETLDGDVLMSHNASAPINPGSVLKLAPTLMALERFGPGHRFRTAVLWEGASSDGVLDGSLGVRSDGDPNFGREEARRLADAVKAAGIREVNGDLVVSGPFSFFVTEETPEAARRLRDEFVRDGVKIHGAGRIADAVAGEEIAAVESVPLLEIVQRQNAHSVNRTADNLGTTVGGPAAIQSYLVETVGVPASEVVVGHASGLGHNAVSARGVMLLLRALEASAERYGLTLDQIIPLNGVDASTMRARLASGDLEGTIAAKTGTHYTQDGGVAAICGVAYTRSRGPVLFVILNSRGPVTDFRKWQDHLLADAIGALGGGQPPARAVEAIERERQKAPEKAGRDPFNERRAD